MSQAEPTFIQTKNDAVSIGYEKAFIKSESLKGQFDELELKDNSWRVEARESFGQFFFILLVVQNIAVFALVWYCVKHRTIENLQPILGIIITGTLTETYFIIRIIVEWVFKDINYTKKQE